MCRIAALGLVLQKTLAGYLVCVTNKRCQTLNSTPSIERKHWNIGKHLFWKEQR